MTQALAYSDDYRIFLSRSENWSVPAIDPKDYDLSYIGGRITYVRDLRGLSTTELARRVECSQPTLWAIETPDTEKRTKDPAAWIVAKAATELMTTWEFLVFGPESGADVEPAAAEAEVLAAYRALDSGKRFALLEFARHLSGKGERKDELVGGDIGKRAKKENRMVKRN